jgi:cupin domain
MKNYEIGHSNGGRTEFHNQLGLTGAEVSINTLPAGASVPFIHSHKENEEIYIIMDGSGIVIVDGEKIALTKGDVLRVSPNGKRQIFASENESITYACIQVQANSLKEFTENDAIIE